MRRTAVLLLISCLSFVATGQILHTEAFSVILDTNKIVKGSIIPDFKWQNQKENLLEFENLTNISFRIKNNALTIANKIEASRFGTENILSGGYLYLEYRRIFDKRFAIEPFMQTHWSEARGLESKYAVGVNMRFRIFVSESIGFFMGSGPFYEYEKWNYNGVPDEKLPTDRTAIITSYTKSGSYVSIKWFTSQDFDFDFSIYHQSRYRDFFKSPRLGSNTSVTYNITEHIGLIVAYQNIYDPMPQVPIDMLFNKILMTIEVAF